MAKKTSGRQPKGGKTAQKAANNKAVSKYQKAINTAYNKQTKADKAAYKTAVNSFPHDAGYDAVSGKRKTVNKKLGITNPTDRVAKTNTAKVYNVNKHYAQAINGVFNNANTMVKGQKAVNAKNEAETIRKAVSSGEDANRQNDVRYQQAKHIVANDSATTRNKLSVNHSQNLNKITTNTAANVASAGATKDKANANSLEKYYNFKGTTLKQMKVNRINKTQEQKNNDRQESASYKQMRKGAWQTEKANKFKHKENMRTIYMSKYDTIAKNKYKDVPSVDKAIKELRGKKDKYKTDKLTTLYNIRASLLDTGSSGGRSGGRRSGGRRSGGRHYGRHYYSHGRYGSGGGGGTLTVGNGNGSGGGGNGGGKKKKKTDNGFNLYRAATIRNNSIGKGVSGIKGGTSAEREYARGHGGGIQKGPGVHSKKHHHRSNKPRTKVNNRQKIRTILIGR